MVISMLFASIALVRALTSEEEQPSVRRELSDEEFQLEGEEIFLEGEETCAVCLETFNGEGALKLRCSHCFHRGCILDWCRHNASKVEHVRVPCPLCRQCLLTTLDSARE